MPDQENRLTDALQIFTDYQATTARLLALFGTEGQLPEPEQIGQLLAEREQLLDLHRQLPKGTPETPELQTVVRTIREQDERVAAHLDALRQQFLGKMNSLQQQKRSLGAYRNQYAIGAAFIDSKK